MDPGTVLAIVSLTIELGKAFGECLFKIKEFKNAPAEIRRVVNEISVLQVVLDDVGKLLKTQSAMNLAGWSVPQSFYEALTICQWIEAKLRTIVTKLEYYGDCSGRQHVWKSILTVFKKGDVVELERQLSLALQLLSTAMQVNSWQYS